MLECETGRQARPHINGVQTGEFPHEFLRPLVGEFRIDEMIVDPDFPKLDPKDKSRVLKVLPPGPENPLGARWMTFVRGEGWTIGIHGTPRPELLGQAVSGGCVRMRNPDVIRVFERVRIGTKVVVEP